MARRPAGRHQGSRRCRRRAHHLRLADLQGPCAEDLAPRGRAHRAQGRHRHRQVEHAGVRRRRLDLQRGVRAHAQSLEHSAHARRLDRRRRARHSRPARYGWRTAPTMREACAGPPPTARSWACGPRPGRVTRGTSNNLFAPLSVQGPMARTVADVALFLDTMAGLCPRDPLTFEAPHRSFAEAVASPVAPKRVAFTADFGGKVPVDRETREICAEAARRFEELGAVVEEAAPDLGNIAEAFLALRSQHFVVERELMLRDAPRPDQAGHRLEHRARPAADAEPDRRRRARARGPVPAHGRVLRDLRSPRVAGRLDARLRCQPAHARGHRRPEARDTTSGASLITAATTMMGLPSIAVPCGFDRYGRPVGLQIVGRHRGEAELLQAAALFEQAHGPQPPACRSTRGLGLCLPPEPAAAARFGGPHGTRDDLSAPPGRDQAARDGRHQHLRAQLRRPLRGQRARASTAGSCASPPTRASGTRSCRRCTPARAASARSSACYHPDRLQHPLRRIGPARQRPVRAHLLGRGARRGRAADAARARHLRQRRDPGCVAHRQPLDAARPAAPRSASSTCSAAARSCGRTCRPRPRCSRCA